MSTGDRGRVRLSYSPRDAPRRGHMLLVLTCSPISSAEFVRDLSSCRLPQIPVVNLGVASPR
jgi:hypothetical protein